MSQSTLPELVMAIEALLALGILVSPLASLYAVRSGWVGFEFGMLLLLASLCYFLILDMGDDELVAVLVEEDEQDVDVGGDDQW